MHQFSSTTRLLVLQFQNKKVVDLYLFHFSVSFHDLLMYEYVCHAILKNCMNRNTSNDKMGNQIPGGNKTEQ